MKPKAFCERMGFQLETQELPDGRLLINIIDNDKRLFTSGTKEGTTPIKSKYIFSRLEQGYAALMNKIIDNIYQ